jgi:hypothetical protein
MLPTRTGKIRNEPIADRIADPDEHHRDLPRHRRQHSEREIAEHHDDVGREREQLLDDRPHVLRPAGPPADFGVRVAAGHPPQFLEPP